MSFQDDNLIELVIEQINSDQESGQVEALYDFLDLIDRKSMIEYLGITLREIALKGGVINKDEIDEVEK